MPAVDYCNECRCEFFAEFHAQHFIGNFECVGRFDSVPEHVTDRYCDTAVGKLKGVVPIAADQQIFR